MCYHVLPPGGWYYDSWDYVRRSRHLSLETNYPYVGKDNKCNKEATNALTDGYATLLFVPLIVYYILSRCHTGFSAVLLTC